MRFTYRREVEREISSSEKLLGDQLLVAADAGANRAKALARTVAYRTGAYEKSIKGVVGVADGKVTGRIVASDFKAGWIEFGTKTQPARGVLYNGAQAAGLKVTGGRGR